MKHFDKKKTVAISTLSKFPKILRCMCQFAP